MKKLKEYLYPIIITASLFIIVYFALSIAPFGEKSVFHYDMGLATFPQLSFLWDILHGKSDFIYNFNIGGGENAFVAISKIPLNLLIGLGKRENILMTGSWLLVLKFVFLSITTYFALKEFFPKIKKEWIVLGTLLNTFSSFSLLYYVIFDWIDLWALFPLVMVGFKKILDGKSGLLYTITVSMCVLFNFQCAYYILFFLILATPIMLILYVNKEKRFKIALKIFFNTVFAVLIAFITFYPSFIFSIESYRITNPNETSWQVNNIPFKILHILTSPILIFYSIKMIKNYKNDKKVTKMIIALFLLLLLPIVIEPFNKLWHTGSYSSLPYRFAFILIFIAVCGMLRYIQTAKSEPVKEQNVNGVKIAKIIIILLLIANIFFNLYALKDSWDFQYIVGTLNSKYYSNVFLSTLAGILILFCSNEIQEEKFRKYVLISIFIINTFFLMFLYIKNFPSFAMIDDENSIYFSQKLYEDFYEENNEYKAKDETRILPLNYPYILKMNSIQNWFHTIPKRQVFAIQKLGYNYYNQLQYDTGGTIISDSVLGVNRIFSKENKDEEVFKKLKTRDTIHYYTYNFNQLPLCKVYANQDFEKVTNYLEEDFKIKDVFAVQNELHKIFFDKTNEKIIEVQKDRKEENIEKKDGKYCITEESKITYEVNLNKKSNLYLYAYDLTQYVLKIQIYKDNTRTEKIYENESPYPYEHHNGILDLGIYDAQKLYIDLNFTIYQENGESNSKEKQNEKNDKSNIKKDNKPTFEEIELGILDIETFLKAIKETDFTHSDIKTDGHTFSINVENAEENQYLMIPINYDEDWSAKINGKETEIFPALGTYMTIPIEKGENHIEFEFFPKDLTIGIRVTYISTILYIIILLICKKKKVIF